jgi:hypothetical protein
VDFLAPRQKEILGAAGCARIWLDPGSNDTAYFRQLMGTYRMGNDPQSSVLSRWNRAYNVPNLFIVDGSSLVTSRTSTTDCHGPSPGVPCSRAFQRRRLARGDLISVVAGLSSI